MNIKKRETMFVLGIVIILLGIFAFTDLAISQALFNPESLYGKAFQAFGELPSAITAVFGSVILITFMEYRVKWVSIIKTIGLALVLLMGASMGCIMSLAYVGVDNILVAIVCMVIMIAVAFLFAKKIPDDKRNNARYIACMGLWLFLFSLLSFNLIKMSWGRMRFVYMDNPVAQFSPWYIRQGFTSDNTFMSFPSGHAAQSSFILMITLLPLIFMNLKKRKTMLCIFAFTWIVLVCISRVVMGMHFSSDVTMGFLITFTLFMLFKNFYLKSRIPELRDED